MLRRNKKEQQALSDHEIDRAMRHSHAVNWGRLLPTSSKDQLACLSPRDTVIINIQDSVDENGNPLPGSHWVATGKIDNHSAWYFDSFGLHPPETVIRALGMPASGIKYAENQIQDDDSGTCGWFAILACALFDRCKGNKKKIEHTFRKITEQFDSPNLEENDDILERILVQTLV